MKSKEQIKKEIKALGSQLEQLEKTNTPQAIKQLKKDPLFKEVKQLKSQLQAGSEKSFQVLLTISVSISQQRFHNAYLEEEPCPEDLALWFNIQPKTSSEIPQNFFHFLADYLTDAASESEYFDIENTTLVRKMNREMQKVIDLFKKQVLKLSDKYSMDFDTIVEEL